MEKFLRVPQGCEILQVTPALVYKGVHYGYIPVVKLGTRVQSRRSAFKVDSQKRKQGKKHLKDAGWRSVLS